MNRFSLAILVAASIAASACGQDVVIQSAEFHTMSSNDGDLIPTFVFSRGLWFVTRGTATYPFRTTTTFAIPADVRGIQSATLTIPINSGGARGEPTIIENMLVVLQDGPASPVLRISAPLGSSQQEIDAAKAATQRAIMDAWEDAGSGAFYGQFDMSPGVVDGWTDETRNSSGDVTWYLVLGPDVSIRLSPLALRDIADAAGDKWAVGAMLTQPSSVRYPEPSWGCCSESAALSSNTPLSLELTYGPSPPLGDFDFSGRTDQADLDFVLLNWGMLDQEELDAVLLTWGQGGPLGTTAVPEPATLVLLLAALPFWPALRSLTR